MSHVDVYQLGWWLSWLGLQVCPHPFYDPRVLSAIVLSQHSSHLPRDEAENAHHLTVAYLHHGEAFAVHQCAHVVSPETGQFHELLAVEKGLPVLLREPLCFVCYQLFYRYLLYSFPRVQSAYSGDGIIPRPYRSEYSLLSSLRSSLSERIRHGVISLSMTILASAPRDKAALNSLAIRLYRFVPLPCLIGTVKKLSFR